MTYNIPFQFSLGFVAAVGKDIRHEETFTLLSPTLNKHNHCSPQRHTIFLVDFLLSSWSQSTKTYDLLKHLLSDLLHLTNTIIAIHKDIRPFETSTFRSPTRNKHNHCSPRRHTIFLFNFLLASWPQSAKTYDMKKHLLSYLLHLTNTIIAVRKDIQYSLSIFSCLRGRNPQRHTTFWNIYFQISYTYQTQPWQSANTDTIAFRSSLVFVAAVRKNIRPEETFTVISPTLKKLLHLTNTIIAVRKDIQYSLSIFSCLRGRNPQRHTTFWNIYFQISYTYQTQPWQSANTDNIAFRSSLVFVAAVRKNIRPEETFTVISPTLNNHNHCSPQRHTIFLVDFLLSS